MVKNLAGKPKAWLVKKYFLYAINLYFENENDIQL